MREIRQTVMSDLSLRMRGFSVTHRLERFSAARMRTLVCAMSRHDVLSEELASMAAVSPS